MSKRKDMLAENQDYVSEWSDMSTGGLLLQWDITIKIQPPVSVLVYYKSEIIIISSKCNSSPMLLSVSAYMVS